MVVFKPFKALRPKNQELAEKIASLPYDVINSEEAHELAKDNQYSFLHIVKPEIDLDRSINPYDDVVYAKAKENFEKFRNLSWLIQDSKPYFYIYRQTMENRSQYGLVGCVSAEDYWNDYIKKHELTRKDKEKDRIRHVDTLDANAGPVFLFYPRKSEIDKIIQTQIKQAPLYDFTSQDDISHIVWRIDEKNLCDKIVDHFAQIPHIYIADGHHRTASGAIVAKKRKKANPNHTGDEEYNFFLAVLFPAEDLHILDYNRVVKDLNGLSSEEFLQRVSEKFDIISDYKERKSQKKNTFGMYLDKKWYLLTAKPRTYDTNDPIKSLDISILQDNLLSPILNIQDPRTDKRIDFIGGIRGMTELERRVNNGEMRLAFSIYPTNITELMKVAEAGLQMPPKSTWFEPKLRSGLLIHVYNE
ncbi:MAG: DUF1015 domain-containing protein [Promethearchaeota archaeon]